MISCFNILLLVSLGMGFEALHLHAYHEAYRETAQCSEIFRFRVCVACGEGYVSSDEMDTALIIFYSTSAKGITHRHTSANTGTDKVHVPSYAKSAVKAHDTK